MSYDVKAILADLSNLADTFHKESVTFDQIMGGCVSPASADSGDSSLNDTIQLVLDEIVALHENIAAWMSDHGDKLQQAHDNYQQVEVNMRELFDNLMPDYTG
jgi:hypothetical protein